MPDPIHISPSKLGLGYLCPSSIVRVEDAVSSDSPPARFGRAGHSVMRYIGEHGETPDLGSFIERYGLDEEQAAEFPVAVSIARTRLNQWLDTLTPGERDWVAFERPSEVLNIEQGDRTFVLQGTMDAASFPVHHTHILDYKLGRVESSWSWAAQGLAYLACEMFSSGDVADDGTHTIIFLGDGSMQTWHATREEVEHWLHEFQGDVLKYYGRFTPGAHCGRCDRGLLPEAHALYCPHAYREVSLFIRSLGEAKELALRPGAPIEAATVAERLLLARLVQRQAGEFVERIRDFVAAAPGERLPLPDGRYLGFKEKTRREVRPLVGLPVLLNYADADTLEPAVKVSKSKAVDAIKAKMEADQPGRKRGWKAALEREIDAKLVEAKALRDTTIKELGIFAQEPGEENRNGTPQESKEVEGS